MSERKSWQARLASYPQLPNVKEIPAPMRARHGEAIATGTRATFAHTVAHAVEETRGTTPGGIEVQMRRLEREGHTVVQRGKRYFVEGFDAKRV